jgi:kynurenine formamidase
VDLSRVGARHPITAEALEQTGADIRHGDIVLVRTDWDLRTPFISREYFTDSPFLTQDGAEWLLARGIRALGMDFVADAILRDVLNRPDEKRTREEFVSHQVLLRNRVLLIENLCNLKQLDQPRILFFALPLNLEGSDGAPCRAVAVQV